jgi:hypothetical protein
VRRRAIAQKAEPSRSSVGRELTAPFSSPPFTLSTIQQLIFQTIGLSSFYLAFFFLCSAAVSDSDDDPFGGVGSEVISVSNSVYIATLGVTIVCGEFCPLLDELGSSARS